MKNQKGVILILVLGLLIVSSTSVLAWWGKEKPRPHAGMPREGMRQERFEKIAESLELTDEQKVKISKDKEALEEKIKELRDLNQELKAKIGEEINLDNPSRKQIRAYVETIGDNQTKMHLARLDHILDMHKELNPEQREIFKEMMQKRKQKPRYRPD